MRSKTSGSEETKKPAPAKNGVEASPAVQEELGQIFKRRAEERYLRRLSPEQLARGVADLAEFIAVRGPGEIKVRVMNPHELGFDANADLVAIDTCMDDQSFIVDTAKLCFQELGLPVAYSAALLINAQRDEAGKLLSIRADDSEAKTESVTRFLLHKANSEEAKQRLASELKSRLEVAKSTVGAFLRLKKICREMVNEYDYLSQVVPKSREGFREVAEFLSWLLDDNFVFFGAHYFAPKVQPEQALGAAALIAPAAQLTGAEEERFFGSKHTAGGELLRVRRSDLDSKVHRAGKITQIKLRRFDDGGKAIGGITLYGLLTRKALSAQGATIPTVRRRLEQILREEEAQPESYRYRAIRNAFNALPVEFLLEAPATDLKDLVVSAARAEEAQESVIHVALDAERQSAFAYVIISQDTFNDALRETLQATLRESTHANYSDHRVSVGFGRSIGLYFFLTGCDLSGVNAEELEAKLQLLCASWTEQLARALRAAHDPETAQRLKDRYGEAFGEGYQGATKPERAVRDIAHLEQVISTGEVAFDFFQEPAEAPKNQVRLRLYRKSVLLLSEVLPILDNFGFKVIAQDSEPLTLQDGAQMWMDTFRIAADDTAGFLTTQGEQLTQGLRAVFRGEIASDPLNRLAVKPGLVWQEVDALRAYLGYALQTRPTLAREALQRVLALRPEATRALVDLFQARFSPEDDAGREARITAARDTLVERLRRIQDATEFRVFKIFENLIESTVRTNYYRTDKKSHYISYKFLCAKLEVVPEPRPMFEIFVHAATVEGVHLRGGRIARGGLRWSDRLDDYRTEVFGLMRTQMVKNVLIVPVGAKGGFILKNEPAGIDRRAYADKMYETFIRGLLDVTDNIVDGKPVPPPRVVRHDETDPYLVVAADKGTAHLSDTANRLSAEYNFWLQDAFASGGGNGYDHKLYAITARGAWACSRHLFSFLNIDPEKDPIRVVGIGDMSGDVFGNGMLLSKTIKLLGAFDHRHIFLDPDPDIAVSFKERERLFNTPRSSWADYDRNAMSKGGGVFSRTEKAIPLSPESQKLLGVTESELAPEAVIRRLLTLDIDLIWNGGIGTFVKSSEEDHPAVGDRVNDALRVDGREVKAKVIGEGGNLGLTQRGRVEYARHGGRINTDAIDNSGGVDLSDHEVNLKILLSPLVAQGKLPIEERNKLLKEIANEVCEKVVENNNAHALMLTLDEIRSRRDPYAFIRAIRFLDEHGVGIPSAEQVPGARDLTARGLQHGFFRPELAKVSAYTKMYIFGELLRADPLRFPDNDRLLLDYYPKAISERYQDAIEKHLLIREILATVRTNEIAQYAGATLFPDLVVETDRPATDVALAYTMASTWLGADALRQQIMDAPDLKAEARYQALIQIEEGLRESISWLLHFLPSDLLWSRAQGLNRKAKATDKTDKKSKDKPKSGVDYSIALQALREQLPQSASRAWRRVEQDTAKIQELGLPEALAREVGLTNQWSKVFPIAELGERTGRPLQDIARTYLTLGQETRLNALILRIGRQPATDAWEALALRGLRASLLRILLEFTQKSLEAKADPSEVLSKHPAFLSIAKEISITQPNPEAPVAISVLVVVAEKLRKAIDRAQLG